MENEAPKEQDFEILEAGQMVVVEEDAGADSPAKSYHVRIIAPGWGSAGYYSDKVLQESTSLFTKGLPVYADHPKLSDLRDRLGVRSVRDQIGAIGSDAKWDSSGKLGPGIYASLDVFESDRQWVYERRNTCGLSMHANGKRVRGKMGDRAGYIVTGLKKANSVDVVTSPGAGGGFASILESLNQELNKTEENQMGDESQAQGNIAESNQEDRPAANEANARDLMSREEAHSIYEYKQMEAERNRLKKQVLRNDLKEIVDNELYEHRILDVTRRRLSNALPDLIIMTEGCLKSVGNGDYEIQEAAVKAVIAEQVEHEKVYINQVWNDQGNMIRGERIVESTPMTPVAGPKSVIDQGAGANSLPGSGEHFAEMFESELGLPPEVARAAFGVTAAA